MGKTKIYQEQNMLINHLSKNQMGKTKIYQEQNMLINHLSKNQKGKTKMPIGNCQIRQTQKSTIQNHMDSCIP
jgi:hypothetical protein